MIIPDFGHASYKSYEIDGFKIEFCPFKFSDLDPMWRTAAFINGHGMTCIVPCYHGEVSWGKKVPSQLCQYYIEAILVQERIRICDQFNWNEERVKMQATLDGLLEKITLLGPQVEKNSQTKLKGYEE